MQSEVVYILCGLSLLLAVILPVALARQAVSAPMVLLLVGALIGLLPVPRNLLISHPDSGPFFEHLTEFCVLISLMGVGLALDRPLSWRSWSTWRRWGATWRLLSIGMPLAIGLGTLLGWWLLGLAPAVALLLGSVLSPTDPVLASDVQVGGPSLTGDLDPGEEIDERDEVRFALTSEAGLNDGLAFPFVYAALFALSWGSVTEWGLRWLAWELVGKVAVGVVVGSLTGLALAKTAFRARPVSLRVAETGEPLLALAAVLLAYGLAELAHGYGFLAVFVCAMTLRSMERGSEYHAHMHGIIERLERLLTLAVLLLLGVSLTNGLLVHLTLRAVLLVVLLIFVVRPATAWLALRVSGPEPGDDEDPRITRYERWTTAFFGVRGVGSLFYLTFALEQAHLPHTQLLWSTVALTITVSVVVHGVTATPVMQRLDRLRGQTALS